jgi:hypothetical protein
MTTMKRFSRGHRACLFAAVLPSLMACAGCGPQAGALWFFMAEPKEEFAAEHRLAIGPALVLVDDPLGQMDVVGMDLWLAEAVRANLLEMRAHEDVVPAELAQRLKRLDADYPYLSVREIGERVGAEQVIYILVTRCRLQDVADSDVFRGQMTAQVKVIDVLARPGDQVRIWPRELEGREINVVRPQHSARGEAARQRVAQDLVAIAARDIARLFCDYEIDPRMPDG